MFDLFYITVLAGIALVVLCFVALVILKIVKVILTEVDRTRNSVNIKKEINESIIKSEKDKFNTWDNEK